LTMYSILTIVIIKIKKSINLITSQGRNWSYDPAATVYLF
jgi:hypothetical protein